MRESDGTSEGGRGRHILGWRERVDGNRNPNYPIYDRCDIRPRYALFGPLFLEWVVWATIFGDGPYSMPASANAFTEAGAP